MICVFPVRYLKIIYMAVYAWRQSRAALANTFKSVGIGSEKLYKNYVVMKELESCLERLYKESQNAKAKVFVIGFGRHGIESGMYDGSGFHIEPTKQ